ncbi:ATP-binding protein [Myroides marinus]|nr:ATP-binding protein [Myroides marinus]
MFSLQNITVNLQLISKILGTLFSVNNDIVFFDLDDVEELLKEESDFRRFLLILESKSKKHQNNDSIFIYQQEIIESDKENLKSIYKVLGSVFWGKNNKNINQLEYLISEKEILHYNSKLHEYYLDMYSIVLNYSIYGLNSEVMGGWLNSLFHKNDGYRTPIVINPYREEGNININTEYTLAQSRLLLNHYVIKNENLLDNVKVKNVRFYLDCLKHQYLKNVYNPITEQMDRSDREFANVLSLNSLYILDTVFGLRKKSPNYFMIEVFWFFDVEKYREVIYEGTDFHYKVDSVESLSFYNYLKGRKNFKNIESTLVKLNLKCNISEFANKVFPMMILNMSYIFKKIYKITKYDNYKMFKVLYTDPVQKVYTISVREIFEITLSRIIRSEENIEFNTIITQDNKTIIEQVFEKISNILEEHRKKLQEDGMNVNPKILQKIYDDTISDFRNSDFISNNITLNDYLKEKNKSVELTYNEMLYVFFSKLEQDDSHVTFKLKQALKYYETNFFFYVNGIEKNENNDVLSLGLDSKYFDKLKQQSELNKGDIINNMPLAMVQPNISVTKTVNGKDKEYDFRALSSGEQQLIHSLLTVSYHIYNLKSISTGIVYKEINLVCDEIELYFHPEYQRVFVKELIRILSYFEEMKYNILLSTHSPFILSDIPSQNVLKLKEGKPMRYEDNIKNSFGANIHDLLADEFFLKDGFMGEFAKEKISSVIKFLYLKNSIVELNSNISNSFFSKDMQDTFKDAKSKLSVEFENLDIKYSKEEVEQYIKLIGEPMLAIKIKEMSDKAFNGE